MLMVDAPFIRFDDGAAYERMMGVWSQSAGNVFLDWLAPRPGLRWADIGCGNGAFSELVVQRFVPRELEGVDPSEGQLAYARGRLSTKAVTYQMGDAMALPFSDGAFDVAVMALVLFFVSRPERGVSEMARTVTRGGSVAAYSWDMDGGGFPLEPMKAEMREMGLEPLRPPQSDTSRTENLIKLWQDAGLRDVETRRIDVTRNFDDFEDFWQASRTSAMVAPMIAALSPAKVAELKQRVSNRLGANTDGTVTCTAFANAIKGRVP
jgi:ubiquinone/menaquinone biosynthesis C-methylase UbiE